MMQLVFGGYEPDENDWHIETPLCVDQLLDWLDLAPGTSVLDPAAGIGTIVDQCRARGLIATGSDLIDRNRPDFRHGVDFTIEDGGYAPGSIDALIFNPPFFHSEGARIFIEGALRVARDVVAAFVPTTFQHSQERQAWWRDLPGKEILILSTRPSCPPGTALFSGIKRTGGKRDYIWVIARPRGRRTPFARTWWI